VSGSGNITQSAAITISGTSSFTTSASNATITLTTNTNALTGAITLSTTGTAGNVQLTNNLATQLAASTVNGNLTVIDRVGNLTQSGALTVAGTSSFTNQATDGLITLNTNTNALTGAITLSTTGSSANASLTNNVATALNSSTVNGNLTITNVTGGSSITVGSGQSITTGGNGNITLTADAMAITGTVTASGQTVTLQPNTASRPVIVGGTSDPAVGSDLYLSTANLNNITATTLAIGNTGDSGLLTVNAALATTSGGALQHVSSNLNLLSGSGGISIANAITMPASGVLTLNSSSTSPGVTQSAAITVTNLLLLGSGGIFNLSGATNAVGTLATGNLGSGTVNLNNGGTALSIGTVSGNNGVTAATLTLTDTGTVTQTQAITATNLLLLGSGGTFNLSGATNAVATLATGNLGSGTVNLSNGGTALSIGTVSGNIGVTAATLTLTDTGTVTQSQAITATNLLLLGSGGTFNLSGATNAVATLATGNLGSGTVNLNNGGTALSIGTVSGNPGVTAATLTLTDTGTVSQSQAITAANLLLLGSGGTYTLTSSSNSISTVAANTGSVNLTNNQALTIGTVVGTVGWTTTGNSTLTANGSSSDITVASAVSWSGSMLTLSAGRNVAINAQMNGGTTGNLTATAGGSLTIGASGPITGQTVALSAVSAFINNLGSTAVTASNRWLIYSSAPDATGENFGSLNSNNTAIWGNTYTTLPPASVTLPGNRYIFATPATLTVTSLNDSKTYGSTANLSLYTVTGFQAGVANAFLPDPTTVSGTPGFFSAGAPATANAGSYAIIVSQGTLTATNGYTFAFNSTGLLTVNPQTLTITANDAAQTYNNVPFSGNGVTYNGFVNGQNSSVLSGTIAYGGNSQGAANVGTYTIIPSGQTSSNYAINYVNGTLTINPQALTITANNVTQTFNNVPYSGGNGVTYNGFVNGQNSSVLSGTITYGGNSQGAVIVGAYTIIPSGQTSSNYAINYVNGTLTVNPPPITVVLDALVIVANAAGTTSPSSVMNTTVLLTSTLSLPGNVMPFGGNTVLPYGDDTGAVGGSTNQQTSNASSTDQQTSNATVNRNRRRDAGRTR
jgi:hypothetical protein